MKSYEGVKYKPGIDDSRSTISLDIKLPIGYSLVAPAGYILHQAVFSEVA